LKEKILPFQHSSLERQCLSIRGIEIWPPTSKVKEHDLKRDDTLYLSLEHRCGGDCQFCVRRRSYYTNAASLEAAR
jgi:hypothetical protein